MEIFRIGEETLLFLLGSLVVVLVAISRFNDPLRLPPKSPDNMPSWAHTVRNWFKWNPHTTAALYRPARANTTLFKYRLYQLIYAVIAFSVYWLFVQQPVILNSVNKIIQGLAGVAGGIPGVPSDIPYVGEAGPLLIAAFVLLVLPNVPPFKGADASIRRALYRHASIPAQQLREMNRLSDARYEPPQTALETVRTELVAEGFLPNDIVYDPHNPTTQSLWTKCALLIRQVRSLEAEDNYKTAFSVLLEPETDQRSVEAVKAHYDALFGDAKACFTALRSPSATAQNEVEKRNETFRVHCKELLELIYSLLSRVSLHAHYGERERVEELGKLGFKLRRNNALPDANEVIALIVVLGAVLVFPLSRIMGVVGAVMIGGIMVTAVLTPIILAYVCPRLAQLRGSHAPAIAFPVAAGIIAWLMGGIIITVAGFFTPPTEGCPYSGLARYSNCSYPWSLLHAGISTLIAWRMRVGTYPAAVLISGFRRYRVWGSIGDSAIFLIVMLALLVFAVKPMLRDLGRDFEGIQFVMLMLRIGLVASIIGFFVPTWYRAQQAHRSGERRGDLLKRKRFEAELKNNPSIR